MLPPRTPLFVPRNLSGDRFPCGLFTTVGSPRSELEGATGNSGSGGNVEIIATNVVEVSGTDQSRSGSFLSSGVMEEANADTAGNISIDTGQLVVSGGAFPASGTQGRGDGGNLTLRARDSVELVGRPSQNLTDPMRGQSLSG